MSVTHKVMNGAFIAMSHAYTGESLAPFLSVTVLHVFGGTVHLFRREAGVRGVRVVVWRHAVDILSCRQTWSALFGGGRWLLHAVHLCLQRCARFFLLRNTKVCLRAHSPAGLEEEGQKSAS